MSTPKWKVSAILAWAVFGILLMLAVSGCMASHELEKMSTWELMMLMN